MGCSHSKAHSFITAETKGQWQTAHSPQIVPTHCHGEEIGDQTLLHECPSTLLEWIQPLQNIQCANLAVPVKINVTWLQLIVLLSHPSHWSAPKQLHIWENEIVLSKKKNKTAKAQLYKHTLLDLNIKHGIHICDALIILLIFHH